MITLFICILCYIIKLLALFLIRAPVLQSFQAHNFGLETQDLPHACFPVPTLGQGFGGTFNTLGVYCCSLISRSAVSPMWVATFCPTFSVDISSWPSESVKSCTWDALCFTLGSITGNVNWHSIQKSTLASALQMEKGWNGCGLACAPLLRHCASRRHGLGSFLPPFAFGPIFIDNL